MAAKLGQTYEYEWYDHYSTPGWKHPEDIQNAEPYVVKSIGKLVGEDKLYLYFTDGITNVGQYRGLMAVFKGALKSKKVLSSKR